MRLILVGCVQQKRTGRHPAKDLYTSPLFQKRRAYAETELRSRTGVTWAILSAVHGIVRPDQPLYSYEKTIATVRDVVNLSKTIEAQLQQSLWRDIDVVEVHAGAKYVEAVQLAVMRIHADYRTIQVETPLAGLQLGEQLAWYNREAAVGGSS